MKIAVLSDPHIGVAKQNFLANGRIGVELINDSGADLCVALGDVTLDGAESREDCLFAQAELEKIACPLHVLAGNHDVGDVSRTGRQPVDTVRLARWREVFGPDWWSLDIEDDWRLIGLNSQILSTGLVEEAEQWAFLEQALASAGGRRLAVFLHQPLFMHDWDEPDMVAWAVLGDSRRRLKALFAAHDVALVVCAHVHRAQVIEEAAMRIVWTPATSFLSKDGSMPKQSGSEMLGVTMIELKGREAEVAFVGSDAFEASYIEDFKGSIYPPPGG